MTVNQKRAWGNIIVWGSFLVASAIVLSVNGTIFFWQEDALRNTFYAITGAAFVAWFIMMLVVWLTASRSKITADERDNEIMSRVNAAAGPIAMTAVAASALDAGTGPFPPHRWADIRRLPAAHHHKHGYGQHDNAGRRHTVLVAEHRTTE
jgi:hypothetical protein